MSSRLVGARRTDLMRESVIRDMTRLAIAHGAINLSQGYPDFPPPPVIVEAAKAAIDGGENQYTNPWGYPPLLERLAERYRAELGWEVDAGRHVTVTCGVTEGLASAMLAIVEPGDEVIVLEPAHDNYWPSVRMADAVPVAVALRRPDHRLPIEDIAAAITPRTKAILLNTPHNPTGRVFDDGEIAALADLVVAHDLALVTDEIYDRITFDGLVHRSPGRLDALRDRTITLSGLGKTFSVTGWRLGYMIAPDRFADAVHRIHDFVTICAPTPLQAAACAAMDLPESYYEGLRADYAERRAVLVELLRGLGFEVAPPEGAYYALADFRALPAAAGHRDATSFARWMTTDVGVAVVAGDAAYSIPGLGVDQVRFAFCKKLETLHAAAERMRAALG
ncbi:MAG: aminotransferase class I/II-fold pyridoxal phosphate-dependent enzyme [Acidimicrobiia bacterium]|nr:aminotransferase class I/II-fold pyridoxal phosphate-dependent enzyme [Acidimicrobiia bacterium]